MKCKHQHLELVADAGYKQVRCKKCKAVWWVHSKVLRVQRFIASLPSGTIDNNH